MKNNYFSGLPAIGDAGTRTALAGLRFNPPGLSYNANRLATLTVQGLTMEIDDDVPMPNAAWPAVPAQTVEPGKFPVIYPGQPDSEAPEAFRLRRNHEIQMWLSSVQAATSAKDNERAERDRVKATLFPNPTKGTQRYDLGNSYAIKMVYTLAYKLGDKDKTDNEGKKIPIRDQIVELEDAVAAMGEQYRLIFEDLVTWNPEISGSKYEKLNPRDPVAMEVRRMIDEYLTITPGAPQMAFEEPKKEGN